MKDYLIVHSSILPKYYYQVIKVRQFLQQNPGANVSKSCKDEGISRSTYYKYKDYIFLPNEFNQQKAIISLDLSHEKGTLSKVLNTLSDFNTNILTISQALPINNVANVNISLDILNINNSLDDLIKALGNIKGVINAQLINLE